MADNVLINTGTGPQVAAEMIGTALHQKIKFVVGSSGTASAVVFGQTNMAASFPIVVASDQSAIPISGTVSATPLGTQNVLVIGTPTVTASQGGTWDVSVSTVSTLLGTITISGTVTGLPSGTQNVSMVNSPTVTVSPTYINAATDIGVTGTGILFIGVQSGATTSRAIMVTTTGAQHSFIINSPVVTATVSNTVTITGSASMSGTGNVTVVGTVPVTLASLATVSTLLGTVSISGSMSVINTPTVTIGGTASAFLLAGTTRAGSFILTAHQSNWSAAIIATTSDAGGVIIKTSGAHTLYITDLMVNVAGPMSLTLCSETTPKMYFVGLATNGGAAMNNVTPIVLASAESLRVVCGSSGSCSVFAAGYTVT